MSLLLDALKKAAEEKQKKSQADEKDISKDRELESSNAEPEESLDLELNDLELDDLELNDQGLNDLKLDDEPLAIEDPPNESHAIAGKDQAEQVSAEDLPSLDDELMSADDLANGDSSNGTDDDALLIMQDESPVVDQPMDSQAEADQSTRVESTPNPTRQPDSQSPQPAVATSVNTKDDGASTDDGATTIEAGEEAPGFVDKPAAMAKKPVLNKEALNMMINRGKREGQRKKRLTIYGGTGLLVVLIIMSAVYFYYDSQQQIADLNNKSKQAFTVKQNNSQASAKTAAVKPNTIESAGVKQATSQIDTAQVSSPSIKQLQTKAVKNKPPKKQAVKQLRFEKKVLIDPIDDLLSRAYEKFMAQNYQAANEIYQQVLSREPQNRDAILGVAAVAMKQQRYEFARQNYKHLLILNPKDSLAKAGLSSVESNADDESRLKFMLHEQPDASHLYFALGSVYVNQQRWSDAQQAFFKAWSGKPGNADYAYNLAVSLDQMGKFKQAKDIYKQALKLESANNGSFSSQDIRARIDLLESLKDE